MGTNINKNVNLFFLNLYVLQYLPLAVPNGPRLRGPNCGNPKDTLIRTKIR